MNEIEHRIKHAQKWQRFLEIIEISYHWEWCIHVGLCETAGWVNKDGHGMLEWVKPGYKDI